MKRLELTPEIAYPAGGDEPRFKVAELEWFTQRGADLDAYVLDRAYCYAIVAGFHSTSLPRWLPRAQRIESIRNRAIGLAAMLEAEHAVG